MNDLILDRTILHARPMDFWPLQVKGEEVFPACVDLFTASGLLRLTHIAMSDWFLVTPELIRVAAPTVVNIEHLHASLATGGALRSALVELRCAAIVDRGIMAACVKLSKEMEKLAR